MLRILKIAFVVLLSLMLFGCNTLLSTSTTKLEIVVPGKIKIPQKYHQVAVRYNNSNVAFNSIHAKYIEDDRILLDSANTDSIASELYFDFFVEHLEYQQFLDTVIELEKGQYSNIRFNDSLVNKQRGTTTGADSVFQPKVDPGISSFTDLINTNIDTTKKTETKFIDPKLGLYSKEELAEIADTTGAGLLMSLDYFASLDGIWSPQYINRELEKAGNSFYQTNYGRERVYVMAGWNFYDLKNQELLFFYLHKDSVDWTQYVTSLKQAIAKLPPRREAVFASAEITGENFAEYLVPHWIEVERMYYTSGHVELNKTEQLVQRNEWMEAAKIWKNNVNNKNKSIAAKSMFNLALACEISGDMDAAIDWAVKSYHVFGNKNEVHAANCKNYIDILGMRKKDIKQIESTDNSE